MACLVHQYLRHGMCILKDPAGCCLVSEAVDQIMPLAQIPLHRLAQRPLCHAGDLRYDADQWQQWESSDEGALNCSG